MAALQSLKSAEVVAAAGPFLGPRALASWATY